VFDLEANQTNLIRLWAIGNTEGSGGKGDIFDVKLSAVYENVDDGVKDADILLSSSTTAGYGGFVDASTPGAAVLNTDLLGTGLSFNDTGLLPQLSNGHTIPRHGTYGEGWEWQEFLLGDFTLADSQIEDFIYNFPVPGAALEGQINVYEITIDASVTAIHFDLYDNIQSKNKSHSKFAPFSHDGGTGTNDPYPVPAPAGVVLLGLGMLLLGSKRARVQRSI
jgi:hypothetical protein